VAKQEVTIASLCKQWQDAQDTCDAVQGQTATIQGIALDELCRREPASSCAFLRALARGERAKPKDYFKEPEKSPAEPKSEIEQAAEQAAAGLRGRGGRKPETA
jgi:hypothetical protein